MSRRPTKVQRLVRLNQFREEVATDALRQAIAEQAQAKDSYTSSVEHVESLGAWKAQSSGDGGLDLSLYTAVLELERQAMGRTEELQSALAQSEHRSDTARHALAGAASATRASENRDLRERQLTSSELEKRSFDQISDTWLNNRESIRD